MANQPPDTGSWVSNGHLQLEIKSLRSEIKVWIIGAVGLNQLLAQVDVPPEITGVAIAALAAKGLLIAKGGLT